MEALEGQLDVLVCGCCYDVEDRMYDGVEAQEVLGVLSVVQALATYAS